MIVNNLICETLWPENRVARLYKYLKLKNEEEKNLLIKSYNEYNKKCNL
jgi:hypothetical protein